MVLRIVPRRKEVTLDAPIFDTAAILVVLAAVLGLFNHHVLRLPFAIGLLVSALVASMLVLALDALVPSWAIGDEIRTAVAQIDFHTALMHGMLSFLLFAGALHLDLEDLLSRKVPILLLASVGLLISTAVVGFGAYYVFRALDLGVSLGHALVFGALISPTDPIAVLGILKSAGAPRGLEIKVAGESLFNDGFAVLVFTVLLAAVGSGNHGAHGGDGGFSVATVLTIFLKEVVGGVALGLFGGLLVYRAMRALDEPNLEILLSVALVMGITVVAFRLHTSAPLACVVAGLFIGNHGRRLAMSDRTRNALDITWSFLDETLNAVLFLLVGLEVVAISTDGPHLLAAVATVPIALLARWVSVSIPALALRARQELPAGTI
ncbi:MAG: cation:proton antiporter, partial [Candidatus Eisenbacteria bacterium]